MHRMGRTRGSLRTDAEGERGHAAFIILRFRENIFLIFEVLEEKADGKGKIEREADRKEKDTEGVQREH